MIINTKTDIYASFSMKPGNQGAARFNTTFQKYGINAIYLPIKATTPLQVLSAAHILNLKGFALSMPLKCEIMQYLYTMSDVVDKIHACNTVIVNGTKLHGENTDILGVFGVLSKQLELYMSTIYIIGNGGFSKAIQYVLRNIYQRQFIVLSRSLGNLSQLTDIKHSIVFNATPIDFSASIHPSNEFIDGRPETKTGKLMSYYQAQAQLNLYLKSDEYELQEC